MASVEKDAYVHRREDAVRLETLMQIVSVDDGGVVVSRVGGGVPELLSGSAEEFLDEFAVIPASDVEEMLGRFEPISVNATDEDDLPMHGYSNGALWNGWEVPWFTLEEIERSRFEGILSEPGWNSYVKFLLDDVTGVLYEISDQENRGFSGLDEQEMLEQLRRLLHAARGFRPVPPPFRSDHEMTVRVCCSTPGCRRTTKPGRFSEWVCQKCYDRVPQALKREHVEAKRLLRSARRRAGDDAGREEAWERADAAWQAVRAAARGGIPDEAVLRSMGVV